MMRYKSLGLGPFVCLVASILLVVYGLHWKQTHPPTVLVNDAGSNGDDGTGPFSPSRTDDGEAPADAVRKVPAATPVSHHDHGAYVIDDDGILRDVTPKKMAWPSTDPPDKTNPYWEMNNNLSINGTPYWKVEVKPGKWEWQVNEASLKLLNDEERHRAELWMALRTRVLAADEWKEVLQYGDRINRPPNIPYFAEEKSRELNDAYATQQLLRLQRSAFRVVDGGPAEAVIVDTEPPLKP